MSLTKGFMNFTTGRPSFHAKCQAIVHVKGMKPRVTDTTMLYIHTDTHTHIYIYIYIYIYALSLILNII